MAEKHLKKCSSSLIIRKIQIKTTLKFRLIQIRMAKIKNSVTVHAAADVEKEEHSFIAGGYDHSGNQSGDSSENWK